ncbi:MAG: hypothetical protein C4576_12015 [Desulfobacteraceae bacterium]|nr:MAG: hypothetical protein C4576_12015 [Desulfobacteraceae bacterium]
MIVSADYLCPVRGITTLEAPHPDTLLKSARAAKDLGLGRITLPLLEESLAGSAKARVKFLDGLIVALDRIGESGLSGSLLAPASKLLALRWAPPYMVHGHRDPKASPVFVDGGLRNLHPLNWWADPPLIQRRLKLFRELLSALAGHPCLKSWILLDRAFECFRPEQEPAEFVLRSYIAEVREKDETAMLILGLGWSDLIRPEPALGVVSLVDGIRISGSEYSIPGLPALSHLAGETKVSAFLTAMSIWLFEKPLETQVGLGLSRSTGDPEEVSENILRIAALGATSLNWISLVDPLPELHKTVPWTLSAGLNRTGLLDPGMEPKKHTEEWIKAAGAAEKSRMSSDFIDIGKEEYIEDPAMHIARLWDHFLESL